MNIDVVFLFRRWPKGWIPGHKGWLQRWHTIIECRDSFPGDMCENMSQFYDVVVGVRV